MIRFLRIKATWLRSETPFILSEPARPQTQHQQVNSINNERIGRFGLHSLLETAPEKHSVANA